VLQRAHEHVRRIPRVPARSFGGMPDERRCSVSASRRPRARRHHAYPARNSTSDLTTQAAAEVTKPGHAGAAAAEAPAATATMDALGLNDGEIIILALKASPWHIVMRSLGVVFGAGFVAVLLAYTARTMHTPWTERDALALGVTIATLQLVLQTIDWMSRTYMLTDRRIVTVQGVFRRRISQTALRHVEHVAMHQSDRERWVGIGDLLFTTDECAPAQWPWTSVADPRTVQRKVIDAIDRYGRRHPGSSCD